MGTTAWRLGIVLMAAGLAVGTPLWAAPAPAPRLRPATPPPLRPSTAPALRPSAPPPRTMPRGASDPGTPLEAYGRRRATPPTRPDRARGWAQKPGTTAAQVLLWIPRGIFYFPNLVLKTVFYPIEKLAMVVDKYAVVDWVKELLYNEERTMGLLPSVSSESGYGLSYGAYFFHKNVIGHEERLSLNMLFGGRYQVSGSLAFKADRLAGTRMWLEARTKYEVEPGLLFFGIGDPPPGSRLAQGLDPREAHVGTRFREERILGLLRAGVTVGDPGLLARLGGSFVYNYRTFGPEDGRFDQPSIEQIYDVSRLTGWGERSHTFEVTANVVFDTTDSEMPSKGLYLDAFGGAVFNPDGYAYGHYGGELSVFVNLFKKTRVLLLRVALEHTVGDLARIPFTELPRLGGVHRLRGFREGRFRDKLSVMGTVQYNYPVHRNVSAHLFFDLGKVGDGYGDVFRSDERWRMGFGGGLTIHTEDKLVLMLGLGYGLRDGVMAYFSFGPIRSMEKRSRQL